jgi:hypothetical protein
MDEKPQDLELPEAEAEQVAGGKAVTKTTKKDATAPDPEPGTDKWQRLRDE